MAPAGYAKLASVMREVSRRTGSPMRTGRVSGCAPSRSGIVQHRDGGQCWGGHHDIGPFPFATIVAKLTSASSASSAKARRHRLHVATHRELASRSCAPLQRTRSARCRTLHHRHNALHRRRP